MKSEIALWLSQLNEWINAKIGNAKNDIIDQNSDNTFKVKI